MTSNIVKYISMIVAVVFGAAVAACSDEGGEATEASRTLSLSPGERSYVTADEEDAATRALPAGYAAYTLPADVDDARLLGFISPHTGGSVLSRLFKIGVGETSWKANLVVDDTDDPYYLYGFMPVADNTSDNISISRLTDASGYADGALLTIRNLNALTDKDVCVIVGVKKTTADGSGGIEGSGIIPGDFSYKFESGAKQDYCYMLLDHLYMQLKLQFSVGSKYDKLRTIKLRSVRLSPRAVGSTEVAVTLQANSDGASPITKVEYTNNTSGTPAGLSREWVAANADAAAAVTGGLTLSVEAQTVLTTYAAPTNGDFVLTTTYDVYDKKGNLTRSACEAVNDISLNFDAGQYVRGKSHTLSVVVQPTYLYVLSDDDVDAPKIIISK